MRLLGCLGLLVVLAFLAIEGWFFWLVSGWISRYALNDPSGHEVVGAIILMVVLMLLGWRVAAWHIKQIPLAFFAGKAGRHFIGALGGILLVIPGFLTDLVGLLLILPPVQSLLAGMGNTLLAVVAKQAMSRMMGGGKMPPGFGGFPGGGMPPGFGGFPGFPGGMPGPDERKTFPGMKAKIPGTAKGGPKTYDTTAEK